jgi:hypothetical protein
VANFASLSRGYCVSAGNCSLQNCLDHRFGPFPVEAMSIYKHAQRRKARAMAAKRKAEAERKVEPESKADQDALAFAQKLVWHMDKGTGAEGRNRRWTAKELAFECGVSDRAVRNWRNGTYLPDIETLDRLFFGADPKHSDAREAFRVLWAGARQRKAALVEPQPSRAERSDAGRLVPEPVRPPTRCFGREREAAPLIAALASPAPAALLVLGGAEMGKTTLTRHVATAESVIARFGRRRWFVALDTVTDASTLRAAVIAAIGLDPAGTSFQAALSHLTEAPALLVLDNLETPWEQERLAVQEVIEAIATTPNVSILASLRGRAAPSAPRWSQPPAPLPQLPNDAARKLFVELAPSAAEYPENLDRFLTVLAGIPLAVELVALRAAGDTHGRNSGRSGSVGAPRSRPTRTCRRIA